MSRLWPANTFRPVRSARRWPSCSCG